MVEEQDELLDCEVIRAEIVVIDGVLAVLRDVTRETMDKEWNSEE